MNGGVFSMRVLSLSVLVLGAAIARADDEDVLAKARAAVQATVRQVVGSGKLDGVETTEFNGKAAFDIDLSKGGTSYGIMVNAQGGNRAARS